MQYDYYFVMLRYISFGLDMNESNVIVQSTALVFAESLRWRLHKAYNNNYESFVKKEF